MVWWGLVRSGQVRSLGSRWIEGQTRLKTLPFLVQPPWPVKRIMQAFLNSFGKNYLPASLRWPFDWLPFQQRFSCRSNWSLRQRLLTAAQLISTSSKIRFQPSTTWSEYAPIKFLCLFTAPSEGWWKVCFQFVTSHPGGGGGYPDQVPIPDGVGVLQTGQDGGLPPLPGMDGGNPQPPGGRPAERVLATRRAVCLWRSRRRSFLFNSYFEYGEYLQWKAPLPHKWKEHLIVSLADRAGPFTSNELMVYLGPIQWHQDI